MFGLEVAPHMAKKKAQGKSPKGAAEAAVVKITGPELRDMDALIGDLVNVSRPDVVRTCLRLALPALRRDPSLLVRNPTDGEDPIGDA